MQCLSTQVQNLIAWIGLNTGFWPTLAVWPQANYSNGLCFRFLGSNTEEPFYHLPTLVARIKLPKHLRWFLAGQVLNKQRLLLSLPAYYLQDFQIRDYLGSQNHANHLFPLPSKLRTTHYKGNKILFLVFYIRTKGCGMAPLGDLEASMSNMGRMSRLLLGKAPQIPVLRSITSI